MVTGSQQLPSGYAATERGVIRKPGAGRIRVALVYPNHYHVGMSNLGFQTVYRLFNEIDHVVCERAFLPEQDGGKIRRVLTVESQKPIALRVLSPDICYDEQVFDQLRAQVKMASALQHN